MAAERERTVAGLLAHLGVDGGGLPAAMPEGAAVEAGRDGAMPWYVEVIVGVGAWLAGVMLGGSVAGLLAVTLGMDEPAGPLLVIGLAAVAAGVAIRRRGGEHVFVRQFALSWSVGGQAMVLGAVLVETGSAWATAVVAAALAAGLLPLVRDGLHQFVAAAIACGVTGYAVVEASPEHATGVLAVLTVPPALVLLLYPTRPLDTRGTAYALLLAVPVLASLFDAPGVAPGLAGHWLARAVYIGALGWLLWLLLGEIDAGRPGVMVAAALAGALTALLSVGIVASLTLLLLAYLLGSRPLAGIGALGVVWFVALFYYQLDVTLLAKSGLLVAVGAAFLALWWALGRRAAA